MKHAEFHEQEFEGFLYSQLQTTDRRLWHPHEVLEHYLGFDRALFLADSYLWGVHGYRGPLRGFAPRFFYHLWPELAPAGLKRTRLPRFRLNCFLQAKRPQFTTRAPRVAAMLGKRRPVYRISTDYEQQRTLERVAERLSDRALFAYAAPVFHRSADLFRHGAGGTMVENTTFPDVGSLSGHNHWYYNAPGATGIRNPDAEPITLPPLLARVGSLLETARELGSQSEELAYLASALREATAALAPTARDAYLADAWRDVDTFCDRNEAPEAVRGFLIVDAFSRFHSLAWLAVFEGAR